MGLRVGIDRGGTRHAVCGVDAAHGAIAAPFEVAHTAAGLAELKRQLAKFGPPPALPVARSSPPSRAPAGSAPQPLPWLGQDAPAARGDRHRHQSRPPRGLVPGGPACRHPHLTLRRPRGLTCIRQQYRISYLDDGGAYAPIEGARDNKGSAVVQIPVASWTLSPIAAAPSGLTERLTPTASSRSRPRSDGTVCCRLAHGRDGGRGRSMPARLPLGDRDRRGGERLIRRTRRAARPTAAAP